MQEQVLIEKLKKRDNDAFRWLVDHYQAKVMNLCYGYLHDRQEAEDIAQDVFIEVLNAIHKFREEAGIATWLYRIAVNKSLNRKKKLQRKNLMYSFAGNFSGKSTANPSSITVAPDNFNPDHHLKVKEDRLALRTAMDKLPKNQKTAFLLSKYENLSYNEISDVMGMSISSVESLLFRAKTNLRKHLEHYMTDEN